MNIHVLVAVVVRRIVQPRAQAQFVFLGDGRFEYLTHHWLDVPPASEVEQKAILDEMLAAAPGVFARGESSAVEVVEDPPVATGGLGVGVHDDVRF